MKDNPFNNKANLPDNEDIQDWKSLEKAFDVLYSKKDTSKLSKKQKLIAYALSLGWESKAVAPLAGIKTKTVNRWLKDDSFKRFLLACDHVNGVSQVNEFFKDRLAVHAKIMDELSSNERVDNAIRIRAAQFILQQALGGPKQQLEVVSLKDIYRQANIKKDEDEEEYVQ